MKSKFYWLFAVVLVLSVSLWSSCGDDDNEACLQDEICEDHFVTTCCVLNVCTWTYNGRTYTDEDELNADLGCSSKKNAVDGGLSVKERLLNLRDKVKSGI